MDFRELFEKHNDEYGKFDLVENKLSSRPDLHAFLLLDSLVPNAGRDMISASEHDKFFLDVDCKDLQKVATEQNVIDLVRCGVMYSGEYDCLSMFA